MNEGQVQGAPKLRCNEDIILSIWYFPGDKELAR